MTTKTILRLFSLAVVALSLPATTIAYTGTPKLRISLLSNPTEQTLRFRVPPGGHLEDALLVEHMGADPVDVILFVADSSPGPAFDVSPTWYYAPYFVGAWMEFHSEGDSFAPAYKWIPYENAHFRLEPLQAGVLAFTIDVPKDAAPGTYLGGIAYAQGKPEALEAYGDTEGVEKPKVSKGEVMANIEFTTRIIRKVYITVTGPGENDMIDTAEFLTTVRVEEDRTRVGGPPDKPVTTRKLEVAPTVKRTEELAPAATTGPLSPSSLLPAVVTALVVLLGLLLIAVGIIGVMRKSPP